VELRNPDQSRGAVHAQDSGFANTHSAFSNLLLALFDLGILTEGNEGGLRERGMGMFLCARSDTVVPLFPHSRSMSGISPAPCGQVHNKEH
jgi:hypothetical protein